MSRRHFQKAFAILALLIAVAVPTIAAEPPVAAETPIALELLGGDTTLTVSPLINYESAVLRVSGPDGYTLTKSIFAGGSIAADLLAEQAVRRQSLPNDVAAESDAEEAGQVVGPSLPDGRYHYEVVFSDALGVERFHMGMFFVEGGTLVSRDSKRAEIEEVRANLSSAGTAGPVQPPLAPGLFDEEVFINDLNANQNTRLRLDNDGGGVPAAWYWDVADVADKFQIWDYQAGPSSPRLSILRGGDVGIGTTTPSHRLQVADTSSQVLRLTTGTTDVTFAAGGNAFVIYDDDGQFPFVIDHSAASSQIWITSGGVGMNTSSPEAQLHVVDPVPGGNAAIVESGALNVKRTDGIPAAIRFSTAARDYLFNNNPTEETFSIRDGTGGQTPFIIFPDAGANVLAIRNNGVGINRNNPAFPIHHSSGARLTVGGTWTNASSRALKTGFQAVESELMLSRLMELPVESWSYKAEVGGSRHVGPVAEDFQRIFGLGDGETISTTDADGVMMAAIQGLKRELDAKDSEIETLRTELEALKAVLQVE